MKGVGGLGEKVKGLKSKDWWLQNSHRDIKYSIGNIVNDIVITTYGIRWVLEIFRGDHLVKYMIV